MARGKHQTLDHSVKRQCEWIKTLAHVTGVIVGRSEACRHKYAPGVILVKQVVPAGLRCTAYAGFGITDIYVYISPAEKIEEVKGLIEARHSD